MTSLYAKANSISLLSKNVNDILSRYNYTDQLDQAITLCTLHVTSFCASYGGHTIALHFSVVENRSTCDY